MTDTDGFIDQAVTGLAEPQPMYKALRESSPVFRSPQAVVLSRLRRRYWPRCCTSGVRPRRREAPGGGGSAGYGDKNGELRAADARAWLEVRYCCRLSGLLWRS